MLTFETYRNCILDSPGFLLLSFCGISDTGSSIGVGGLEGTFCSSSDSLSLCIGEGYLFSWTSVASSFPSSSDSDMLKSKIPEALCKNQQLKFYFVAIYDVIILCIEFLEYYQSTKYLQKRSPYSFLIIFK